ncbi:molybdopterin converting factor subunit 1 [Pelagibacterium limicola]|uniref:molybdopterin converting factor subunit 1 n=1 Tax=Pelagibacterium limicola TaxID=2791022 RepID=UPI0018AF98A6|nr:molybdopterin converting factor subunit 1 [Pelagibacterium limicola]
MKVLYFAWLRERLDRDSDEIDIPASVETVADLMDFLAARDEGFALAAENRALIRAAVDEELVDHDASVRGARTVALFPPMTGG